MWTFFFIVGFFVNMVLNSKWNEYDLAKNGYIFNNKEGE